MNKYLIIPIAIIIIVFIGVITSLFKKEDVNNMIDMKFDNISEIKSFFITKRKFSTRFL